MATQQLPNGTGVPMMTSMRTLEWTNTKTPATSINTAMSAIDASLTLTSGIPVLKVTGRGQMKPRVVTLSKDRLAIFCTHQAIPKGKVSGVMSSVASKLPVPMLTRKGVRGFTEGLRGRYVRYIDVADIDYVCTGTVSTRKLENTRKKNRLKGVDSKIDQTRREIVTVGHHGEETLDILVVDAKARRELIATIRQMCVTFQKAALDVSHDSLLLRYIWYDVDTNRDGLINASEFANICSRINFRINFPGHVFRKFCKERSLSRKGIKLADVLALLMIRKDKDAKGKLSMANSVWNDLFGETDVVDAQDFLDQFVRRKQGDTTATIDVVHHLFTAINRIEMNHKEGEPDNIIANQQISRAHFEVFLYHELNDAYDPSALKPKGGLHKSVSQYFINTSHNTYLTGDQLQSNSSVEMYGKALRRGCKCLELDVWDGDAKKQKELNPVVFHGHTLTSKILFADILQIVQNYLDDNPDSYPIILSLENHCSHPFQTVMAKAIVSTFGKRLYVPNITPTGDLPSPESLRGKVVIKGKRPPDPDDTPYATETQEEDDPYSESGGVGQDGSRRGVKGDSNKTAAKPPKIVKELARLTLFHGTKYKSFDKSIAEPQSHMHSISESKIGKIIGAGARNVELWRKYNVHHMTRTYPAGTRVDSSNYNPILPWAVGSQLVALNFQSMDGPLTLNDGLFRQDGGCGYIPKPLSVMGQAPTEKNGKPALVLKVRVLSGRCLPKPYGAKTGETIDPYVLVNLHDAVTTSDGGISFSLLSHTTGVVNDNGFCPIWDEKKFKEFSVYSPDVAMIQFNLREADVALDENVGYAAIPVTHLRSGFRSIQLYDRNNTRSGPFGYASLLVEIQTSLVRAENVSLCRGSVEFPSKAKGSSKKP